MQEFLKRHEGQILGVLAGFDRVLFRGSAVDIGYAKGMNQRLFELGIRYDRFFSFVKRISQTIKDHAQQLAERTGRPYLHLNSPATSKEDIARGIQQRDQIQEGLICVLSCVEQCQTYALRRRGEENWLHLVPERRKTIQICINGREYLARRLAKAGIGFEKRDNCFTRIDNLPRAQRMMDDLIQRNWQHTLSKFARRFNPWCHVNNEIGFRGYYWTFRQSEYATDVMFRDAASLAEIYPQLVRHAMDHFQSPDVMRFFNRKLTAKFRNEISTDVKDRHEGVRIKHRVEENSIKMYDKQGSVLRVETTMNEPSRFKVRRQAIRKGHAVLDWFHLRKGVIDIERRVEICRAANGRYLEALAVVGLASPVRDLLDPVSRPIVRQGRRYRALRPLAPDDARLIESLLSGEFHVQGFRNRDIYRRLYGQAHHDKANRRRASARITRLLRLLRAHRLIQKVPHTFYYRVTQKGHRIITTALKIRRLNVAVLVA